MSFNDGITHSLDCWKWHHECAKRRIEELTERLEESEMKRLRVEQQIAEKEAQLEEVDKAIIAQFGAFESEMVNEFALAVDSALAREEARTQNKEMK